MYDVVIIGAGVSGSACARELSKYNLSICVVEKEEDVCCGTSKANSAIVHSGIDCKTGTLMAQMNLRGNEMMDELSKELDFEFRRNGSLIVCFSDDDMPRLKELYNQGIANGVPGLKILDAGEAHEMEPNLSDQVLAALYAPTAGIVCPFELNIAMAENAYNNGVEFKFDTEVKNIRKQEKGFVVETSKGDLETGCIVNAAGIYADVFHNMVSEKKLHITPRKGEYMLLDKSAGTHVNHTIFALPNNNGKGVLVTQTVHGNLLIGPTATDLEDREETATTSEGMEEVSAKSRKTVKDIPLRKVITSFAGLRAIEDGMDFVIKEVEDAPGFIDCAGIASPGLTSSPAIGCMVADIVKEKLHPEVNPDFDPVRKGILDPSELSLEERNELIERSPEYGNIICRCEMISEGEILDAIRRPLGAKSLDGVKRRTRAGMGRCQSGFCSPRTMEILSRELGISMEEITKTGGASRLIEGINKKIAEEGENHE